MKLFNWGKKQELKATVLGANLAAMFGAKTGEEIVVMASEENRARLAAAEQSLAASKQAAITEQDEATVPRWVPEMVFNTDGSADGAFCLHADNSGEDWKWETKIDGNTGNEPPTEPGTAEDENWLRVEVPAEEEEAPAEEQQEESASTLSSQVTKLNASLKAVQAALANAKKENAALKAEFEAFKKGAAAEHTTVERADDPVVTTTSDKPLADYQLAEQRVRERAAKSAKTVKSSK